MESGAARRRGPRGWKRLLARAFVWACMAGPRLKCWAVGHDPKVLRSMRIYGQRSKVVECLRCGIVCWGPADKTPRDLLGRR